MKKLKASEKGRVIQIARSVGFSEDSTKTKEKLSSKRKAYIKSVSSRALESALCD